MDHHSERLTLHPFSAEEATRVADGVPAGGDRWAPDYPVADEVPLLRDLARRLGSGTDPHPFTLHMVVERSTGTAIGGLGFFGPPGPDGAVEIGYGLAPSARGRGYATEAVRLAVEIALAGGALRVEAGTDPANLASQRVLLKAGFTAIGRRGDEPGHGAEVFSLTRTSDLDPETYPDTFVDTGFERQSELGVPADD